MIEVQLEYPGYVEFDCEQDEWDALCDIVHTAEEHYDSLDLLSNVSHYNLRNLAILMEDEEPPTIMTTDQLRTLSHIVSNTETLDVPGLDDEFHHSLVAQIDNLDLMKLLGSQDADGHMGAEPG